MITWVPKIKKEMVGFLFVLTGWIYLELLSLLLVETGIKYDYLTEIGKGATITTTKPPILPGRVRLSSS